MPWILFLLLLGSCCTHRPLVVRNEYLDARYLASTYIETPDPRRCWFYGQQLIVNWKIPREWMCEGELHLFVTLRYGSAEIETFRLPLTKCRGAYVYRLIGDCYCEKEGIRTYKIEIYSGERCLHLWEHQVWTPLVEFNEA
ncbi:MAG: hypothetical protein JSR80_04450 [Verrucomicrobia bacterium]|nr:hypothetical protein [Verrucomicrobiota bacterium]